MQKDLFRNYRNDIHLQQKETLDQGSYLLFMEEGHTLRSISKLLGMNLFNSFFLEAQDPERCGHKDREHPYGNHRGRRILAQGKLQRKP